MTFPSGTRVELTPEAKSHVKDEYGAYQTVDGVGVVVANPFADMVPAERIEEAIYALGYGEVWVRWEFDPDTPTPMAAAELKEWEPSREPAPFGRFAVGDMVQIRQGYCGCSRCDFTFGVIIRHMPYGPTRHDYTVQWDDGWVTQDFDNELCAAGTRFNNEED